MSKSRDLVGQGDSSDYEWQHSDADGFRIAFLCRLGTGEVDLINEARSKGKPIDGQHSAQLHGPYTAAGQSHLYVYARNNQLFALNIDGSAHDDSHRALIPNKVADAIRKHFPSFNVPRDNYVENADAEINRIALKLLVEGRGCGHIEFLPAKQMQPPNA